MLWDLTGSPSGYVRPSAAFSYESARQSACRARGRLLRRLSVYFAARKLGWRLVGFSVVLYSSVYLSIDTASLSAQMPIEYPATPADDPPVFGRD